MQQPELQQEEQEQQHQFQVHQQLILVVAEVVMNHLVEAQVQPVELAVAVLVENHQVALQ
jgi:hypothetical protein